MHNTHPTSAEVMGEMLQCIVHTKPVLKLRGKCFSSCIIRKPYLLKETVNCVLPISLWTMFPSGTQAVIEDIDENLQ